MLPENTDKFREIPYDVGDSGPDRFFAKAAGVEIPGLDQLRDVVNEDIEVNGVGWWDEHFSDRRLRILITDHLVDCIAGIPTNLVEGRYPLA